MSAQHPYAAEWGLARSWPSAGAPEPQHTPALLQPELPRVSAKLVLCWRCVSLAIAANLPSATPPSPPHDRRHGSMRRIAMLETTRSESWRLRIGWRRPLTMIPTLFVGAALSLPSLSLSAPPCPSTPSWCPRHTQCAGVSCGKGLVSYLGESAPSRGMIAAEKRINLESPNYSGEQPPAEPQVVAHPASPRNHAFGTSRSPGLETDPEQAPPIIPVWCGP